MVARRLLKTRGSVSEAAESSWLPDIFLLPEPICLDCALYEVKEARGSGRVARCHVQRPRSSHIRSPERPLRGGIRWN